MRMVSTYLQRIRNLDFAILYAMLGESTLAMTFALYVMIARIVGPEQYGIFSAATALTGILGVLIQFGLPVLLTRNVAHRAAVSMAEAGRYAIMQIANSLPLLAIMPVILHLTGFTHSGKLLCYLLISAELCRSIKMLWRGVMKGSSHFKLESISVFIERAWTTLLAAVILLLTHNLILTTLAFALARMLDVILTGLFLKNRFQAALPPPPIFPSYRKALPFALHGLLWVLYYQVDMVMLKAITQPEEVGFYGAAYRVMEIFSALPRVVFYVAFTRFAQTYAHAPEALPAQVYHSIKSLMIIVLPAIVVAGLLQPWIIPMLYGASYQIAVYILAILIPGLSVKMFSTLCEEFLLATGNETKLPPLLLVVAIVNIGTNLLLIPHWGAMGAAIATVVSEIVFCLLGIRLLKHSMIRPQRPLLLGLLTACAALALSPSLLLTAIPKAWILSIIGIAVIALASMIRQFRSIANV